MRGPTALWKIEVGKLVYVVNRSVCSFGYVPRGMDMFKTFPIGSKRTKEKRKLY